jgi:predicted O-methyltransferase YrrM
MKSTITTSPVTGLLAALYADAEANDPQAHQQARHLDKKDFFQGMRKAYMAIGPEFGHLLYSLTRATRAKTVVEFGTSFGVSTIYLAAAVRDNGGGTVITTEFQAGKAEQAGKNLADAGLGDLVEFRVGDALQTLAQPPREIDLVFLDGAKELYLPVLRLLEPSLRSGAIIASDNTDHEDMADFLAYIRTPANGYTSAAICTNGHRGKAHEVTVRN